MDYTFLKEKQARDLRASRVKLVIMLAIMVIVLAFVLKYSSRDAVSTLEKPVSTKVTTDIAVNPGPPPKPAPEIVAAQGEAPAIPPASILTTIEDRRSDLEPGPFFYMLHRVAQDQYGDLKAQAKKGIDWNLYWDKPESLRGEPVEVRGTLIRSWRQGLAKNPLTWNGKPVTDVWAYRVRADGAPRESQGYVFDIYSLDKLYGALPYDEMVTYGRFLKARTLEPDHYVDPELHAAVVITQHFEPLTYFDAPQPPQPIVPDGRPEARAIYYLLKRAAAMPFAELKATAKRGLNQVDYTNNADRYLGKPVAVRGELLRCQRVALTENPLRLESVYYGQIVDADHGINTFYCLGIPDGLRLKDEVVFYGYFLKKWTYTNQGDRETTSPVFVGQQLVKVLVSQDRTLDAILVAMIAVIAVILVIAHFRNRRQVRADAEARRQRDIARAPANLNEVARRVLAEARGGDAPPKPPDSPASPPEPEKKP